MLSRPARALALAVGLAAALVAFPAVPPAALAAVRSPSSGWRIVQVASAGTPSAQLDSVACATPAVCFAVGAQGTFSRMNTLVERYSRGAFTLAAGSPDVPGGILSAIACPAARLCLAVGRVGAPSSSPLVEMWNGVVWKRLAVAFAASIGYGSGLNAVSCTGPDRCWAVGAAAVGTAGAGALIARWNGRNWQAVPALAPAGTFLEDVACANASLCWAGGGSRPGGQDGGETLLRWNGGTWQAVAMHGGPGAMLSAIACPGALSCWAAGAGRLRAWVLHWNGVRWLRAALAPAGQDAPLQMTAFACPQTDRCLGVGGGLAGPTISRWNGTVWSVATAPAPRSQASQFFGVACPAAGRCIAVGGAYLGAGITAPLAETGP